MMCGEKQMEETDKKQDQKIDVHEAERLWQWWLLEEGNFNDRLNFFMVVESVLLGGLVLFLGQGNSLYPAMITLKVFLVAGFLLTIVWIYIQLRQRYVMDVIRGQLRIYLPDFSRTEKEIEKKHWPFKIRDVFVYIVPGIFMLMWGLLFVFSMVYNRF